MSRVISASSRGAGTSCLHGESQRQAIALFDLQVWLWGQDVLHPCGNGLVRFGFHRQPAPPGSQASSMYRLALAHGRRVTLRGFGMFYSDRRLGGIFLERFAFSPRWTPALDLPDNAWFRPMLDNMAKPRSVCTIVKSRHLLAGALRWIIRYEEWAWHNLGHEHRRRAVQQWRDLNKCTVPAGELAAAWERWMRADANLDRNKPRKGR